jgi:hypothetical protein
MAEILEIPDFVTRHDIPAENMLRAIADEEPDHAFVICWPKDGSMPTYHSTTSDMPVVLHRLQTFIHRYFQEEAAHERDQ